MAEDASIRKLLGEPVGNNSSGGKSGEKVPATIGPSTPTTTVPTVPNVLGKAELMQLEQQLLNAAKSGDLQKVRQLLSSPGINKNFTDAVRSVVHMTLRMLMGAGLIILCFVFVLS